MCRKFECRKDIHYKTQTGTSCEKCNSKAFLLGIEPASSGLLDQCSTTELQKPLPTTWARVQKPCFLISVRLKGSICQNLYKNKQKGFANFPVTKLHRFEERKSIKSSGKIG